MDWRKLIGIGVFKDSTGLGPDFPGSAGDRERGKFRESKYPRLTTVAVVGDDGEPVGDKDVPQLLEELLYEVRLLRQTLVLNGVAADTETDL